MASNKKKQRKNQKNNKRRKVSEKSENKTAIVYDNDSDGAESESEKIQKLLEPYTKDQLVEFICDAAVNDSSLLQRIQTTADRDVSHRKVFVHGLGWDTTRETLISAFESYGEIEDCNVVIDRVTGKAKGYGFVLFKSRAGAIKALKQPQKKISNRVTSCQLASIGPVPAQQNQDTAGRKIYVSNVHADADPEKLRAFFEKFGEIETGPLGFDLFTGKSRGFSLFVYKTQEGVKKVLEEPYKMFEGHQLHCQRATENKNKPTVQQPVQAPVLAAVAAAQNLALFGHHPSLNPVYSGLLANPNPGMTANPNSGMIPGSVNPLMAGALNPGVITQVAGSSIGGTPGFGVYSASHGLGNLGASSSVLGAYPSLQGLQSYQNSHQGLQSYQNSHQGLQSYQNSHLGQSSSARTHGTGGSLTGYPSYMW